MSATIGSGSKAGVSESEAVARGVKSDLSSSS
jgi:hypothetical protein